MILIADSGSTKASWCAVKNNEKQFFQTKGINPFFMSSDEIRGEIEKNFSSKLISEVKQLFFYGAGIIDPEKGREVSLVFQEVFKKANINVQSDLMAAVRATLGTKQGIVCILGTGCNSCFFDGKKIIKNTPPLGYILGDEGSGAALGKKLLADYLKGLMPKNLAQLFADEFPLGYNEFLNRVYNNKAPNKFLAGLTPFLSKNIQHKYCEKLVENSFAEFIDRNVATYNSYQKSEVNFVGSVAWVFHDQLKNVLVKKQLRLGKIIKEPLKELVNFHQNIV